MTMCRDLGFFNSFLVLRNLIMRWRARIPMIDSWAENEKEIEREGEREKERKRKSNFCVVHLAYNHRKFPTSFFIWVYHHSPTITFFQIGENNCPNHFTPIAPPVSLSYSIESQARRCSRNYVHRCGFRDSTILLFTDNAFRDIVRKMEERPR